jgi:hypothetical protein
VIARPAWVRIITPAHDRATPVNAGFLFTPFNFTLILSKDGDLFHAFLNPVLDSSVADAKKRLEK